VTIACRFGSGQPLSIGLSDKVLSFYYLAGAV
jgi:hypothetical protein